ncbi:hypothetical protein FJ955_03870 [Mesorhizobium sp. B2-2-2]|uniref:SGNH/GDSL hydrolase family protein n=1 Tax=Mesorhizobium sp. B2-2-2 TaxID=2589964 RepID=UPI00112667C5|nr:SGNH/GDSL hydrolase family protein [Mesorhizobium sp. B2-2-2]TPM33881.1 hypothetical protein FJ955_03870 [Mesorhizobium sp. B2-2-2]
MTSIQIDRTDGLSSAVAIKGPCRVATTANITLSGEQTIDGVSVVTGDRVLVKDQTTASNNGIYIASTGVWRRAKDFNNNRDVKKGTRVYVTDGALSASHGYSVSTTDPIVIDATSILFVRDIDNNVPTNIGMYPFNASPSATPAANSTAINAALAYCAENGIRQLWVPQGTYQCNDDIFNEVGVYFAGPGNIIVGDSGKPISMNSADFGKTVVGMHNLISWHSLLAAPLGISNVAMVGDSNTQGGGWLLLTTSYPDKILTEYGRQKGFSPHVYNFGIGGTGINDLDLTADWVTNTDYGLVIIAYGTNNAAGGIKAYAGALRAKLTTLRAARGGNLGILLKSPITGTDTFAPDGTPHLRDERFMRQVHDVHVQMVQEFNVCAVDTFAAYWYMRGSYGGAHMDILSDYDPVLYRSDAHIHARDVLNTKIWADIMGPVVFPDSVGTYVRNNRSVYYNSLDTDFVPLASALPATYTQGKSVFPVATAEGWPVAGDAYNDRGQFGTRQEVWGDGVGFVRFGFTAWGPWHDLGNVSAAMTLGTNVTIANGGEAIKIGGIGRHRGYYNITGNVVVDQVLLTIPASCRPAATTVTSLHTNAGVFTALIAASTGVVTAKQAITAPAYFSLGAWPIA